jgi:hypothetical protein
VDAKMQDGMGYVALVVGAMTVFAVVLAYGSWIAPGKPPAAKEK